MQGAVEAETHEDDPTDTLETLILLPLLKLELTTHALETGTQEFDDVSYELGTLSIDFSKLTMAKVYVVQHVVIIEIRI